MRVRSVPLHATMRWITLSSNSSWILFLTLEFVISFRPTRGKFLGHLLHDLLAKLLIMIAITSLGTLLIQTTSFGCHLIGCNQFCSGFQILCRTVVCCQLPCVSFWSLLLQKHGPTSGTLWEIRCWCGHSQEFWLRLEQTSWDNSQNTLFFELDDYLMKHFPQDVGVHDCECNVDHEDPQTYSWRLFELSCFSESISVWLDPSVPPNGTCQTRQHKSNWWVLGVKGS